ncbi:GNAT family N-acetyltransferase [candidate division KSB1 bacterium]|nr:GNAT family N-acetyltransferase [candidate division KSB1 bacterium]RQW01179.1 MAG: GNAT family N-acetyltransferase [candidate division KSB1 bacterium]
MAAQENKISIIDPSQDNMWDEFVAQHPNGWLCHLAGWKQLLEMSFSHIKGYYIVKYKKSNNSICAGLPIYFVKSLLTGKRLVSAPFATLFDPLYSSEGDKALLSDAVIQLRRQCKASFIEIRSFQSTGFANDQRFSSSCFFRHHYLELNEEPELLKRRFHRTCVRQRINRSLDSHISLKLCENEKDVAEFYALYLITRIRTNLPPMPYRFFKLLWEIFYPAGNMSILLAQHEHQSVAGMILFKFKKRVSAEFAASDERYKDKSPNHFLFWHAINLAYKEGYSIFDFGRTSVHNQSLLDFKSHWGTLTLDLTNYMHNGQTKCDVKSSEDKLSYKIAKKVNHYIPRWAYPAFGEFCYRHLG